MSLASDIQGHARQPAAAPVFSGRPLVVWIGVDLDVDLLLSSKKGTPSQQMHIFVVETKNSHSYMR